MSKFKVGDRVIRTDIGDQLHGVVKGASYSVESVDNGWISLKGVKTRQEHAWSEDCFELVEGPVRVVTRLEIIDGDYGKVHVSTYDDTRARIGIDSIMNAKELTDAISTLTAIRDALQEQDK